MTSRDKCSEQAVKLRRRAEESIVNRSANQYVDKLSQEETKVALHELLVHQIELEMQNEELCSIRKELENSRARYYDLFNMAPVGYISLNEDGLILESNSTAGKLFGIPASELENKLLSDCIFYKDQDIFYHHRNKLFADGVAKECELRMKRIDKASGNTTFWARLESSVVNTDLSGSKWLSCRVVVSDITENRKLSQQLHHAQRMETIGLLAGGVAHDYNNKLAVIVGYAELALKSGPMPETLRPSLEAILTAAQQSAAITRQLLAVARKQMITPIVIDLNQSVGKMVKMLQHAVGEEIELLLSHEPDLYPIEMDPVQIDQILLNLCLNAKASIESKGRITVSTKNTTFDPEFCKANSDYCEGKYVLIEVSDTGFGMTKEVLERIFEPFFTTKEVGQGTGLGMSVVDGIVKQNNGFIIVSSEPGVGTIFKIFLPAYTGKSIRKQWKKPEDMQHHVKQ